MRKINNIYENPLDDKLLQIVESTDNIYYKLDITPNHLTTVSLIFGCVSAYLFFLDCRILSLIFFLIAYYYDCMDGHFARKYNIVTNFGDFYDHFSDIFKVGLLLYFMHLKNKDKFYTILPIIIILFTLLTIHFTCQEKINNLNHNQPFLNGLKYICIDKEWIHYTKYFGSGTFMTVLSFIIITF
jgi:phosphatidylglycerophosphate synthase